MCVVGRDAGLGVWAADVDTRRLAVGAHVSFVVEGVNGEQVVEIASAIPTIA
jgi:hypothetical protein